MRCVDIGAHGRHEHALGLPGRAGGIQHGHAVALIGDTGGGLQVYRLLPGLETRLDTAHHIVMRDLPRGGRHQFGGDLRQRQGADKEPGATVFQDVGRLALLQVGADRREYQPRTLGGPGDFQELAVILQHHADVIPGFQSQRAEQLRAPVGALIQLAIGHDLSGAAHDDGGLMGVGPGGGTGMRHTVLLIQSQQTL